MSSSKQPKEFRLNLRLSEHEWNKIQLLASNTTCRTVSEYCRKVLLNRPVRVFRRNRSLDDIEETLAPLLLQLKTFGDDFNMLVQQLSSTDKNVSINTALEILLLRSRQFLETTTRIKELLIKISDICAQT